MKKAIIVLILLLSVPALAFKTDNICTTAGWSVRIDKASNITSTNITSDIVSDRAPSKGRGIGTNAIVYVEKSTNEAAFKVRVLVYCYDFHDKFIGRLTFETDGPIYSSWEFNANLPIETYKMTAEVYWKDKYE